MPQQAEQIAQTIIGLKQALNRNNYDSESDESIQQTTNRGNKLKRKAKHVERGRLDLANGVRAYRRRIDYNGYYRDIISKNPPRVDADGDIVEDEEEGEVDGVEPAEEDPYHDVRIENILMPLTAASDLGAHHSLSIPYKSKVLEEMIQNAQEMVRREQEALWKIKRLSSEFRGDSTWMPLGVFEAADDFTLLGLGAPNESKPSSVVTDPENNAIQSTGLDAISNVRLAAGLEDATQVEATKTNAMDTSVTTDQPHDAFETPQNSGQEAEMKNEAIYGGQGAPAVSPSGGMKEIPSNPAIGELNGIGEEYDSSSKARHEIDKNAEVEKENTDQPNQTMDIDHEQPQESKGEKSNDQALEEDGESETKTMAEDPPHAPHRMTTRAKAQAASSTANNSPSRQISPSVTTPEIHPFFIVPHTAIPSRNSGLHPNEADEIRKLLCAYVQKQEEVCRGATRLYTGLLKAKRLRDDVLDWCNAEGHIGEMSDGEDWYDKEKWGLTEDLKKGEDNDEEEPQTTGKKTRNNRRMARDA